MVACVSTNMPSALLPTRDQFKRSSRHTVSKSKNPYRVVKELGSGLQGRVLLAFNERDHAHVAIKLPSAFTQPDGLDVRRLEYQVKSIAHERFAHRRVKHPHVIEYIRSVPGSKQGHGYTAMVTEYAPNGDLFDLMAKTGALPEEVAQFYFHQLLSGIQGCHSQGVIHRDIKPENILLDANFTLKICDFGLAAVARETAEDVVLHGMAGTAMYMAPEITTEECYRATPVDMWAAGVVLFIMLTGYPPFHHAARGDFWYDCALNDRMDRFWARQPDSPWSMGATAQDLISKLLQADPTKRLTVVEALAHPWLKDVDLIDHTAIYNEMVARRHFAVNDSDKN